MEQAKEEPFGGQRRIDEFVVLEKDEVAGLRNAVGNGTGLAGWHGGIADSYRDANPYRDTYTKRDTDSDSDTNTGSTINLDSTKE